MAARTKQAAAGAARRSKSTSPAPTVQPAGTVYLKRLRSFTSDPKVLAAAERAVAEAARERPARPAR